MPWSPPLSSGAPTAKPGLSRSTPPLAGMHWLEVPTYPNAPVTASDHTDSSRGERVLSQLSDIANALRTIKNNPILHCHGKRAAAIGSLLHSGHAH